MFSISFQGHVKEMEIAYTFSHSPSSFSVHLKNENRRQEDLRDCIRSPIDKVVIL